MSGYSIRQPAPPRTSDWYFQRRRRQRDRRLRFDGHPIRIEQIAHRDHLYRCYQALSRDGGHAPGVDGYTYDDLSPGEVGEILGTLSRHLLDGSYRPQEVRCVPIPKPGSDEHRILKIGTLIDRTVGKAVQRAFTGFWEKRFLDCSYGFRPKRNTWRLLADLEVAVRRTGWRMLEINDIRRAFDNVPIDAVVECHRRALELVRQRKFTNNDKAQTLALVERILRGHDELRQRGIDQGAPYSPTALNVLLHDEHDLPLQHELPGNLLVYRYADNLAYLVPSMSEGAQALRKLGRLLKPLKLSLKYEPDMKDLTHENAIQLLGFALRWEDSKLHVSLGSDSFNVLAQRLDSVHVERNPTEMVFQIILGWIDALGPAFEDGNVTEVLSLATQRGFRELPSRDLVATRWKESWTRWEACRKRAEHRARNTG